MDGDPNMDAGAWRREALGLRERVRELEESAAYHESQSRLSDAVADRRGGEADHARFMAAGWRRLAEQERDRADTAEHLGETDQAEIRALLAERADLRAEREAMYAVARAARVACDSVLVKDHAPLAAALDALPCWCGKPDGHASGCPGG